MSHREIVERLLGEPITSFGSIGSGWDYATYEVNRTWVFQFPLLAGSEDSLRRQISLLPEIARELSARVPEPEHVDVSVPVMGYRKIEGESMSDGVAGSWPERFGRFLYDLHMVPPEFVGMRAESAEAVREGWRAGLAHLSALVMPLLDDEERAEVGFAIEAFIGDDENWRFSSGVIHGDLGPEHVLVTPDGDLAGVIDFGDAGVGDPVADFAWMLNAMPEEGSRALAAYGGAPDERFHQRGRFAYAVMPWHEVDYGVMTDQPEFVESGMDGVRARTRFLT